MDQEVRFERIEVVITDMRASAEKGGEETRR
jgi:hypothetical protein